MKTVNVKVLVDEWKVNEIILYTNNTEKRYKAIMHYLNFWKDKNKSKEEKLERMMGIVRSSYGLYRSEIDKAFRMNNTEIIHASKDLLKQYLDEISLGNY